MVVVKNGSRHICHSFAGPKQKEPHVKECLTLVELTGLSFTQETEREKAREGGKGRET